MEHNNNSQSFSTGDNSGVILGTSSDAIVEGLHNGQFTEPGEGGSSPKDDDQIVNEQDQQEVINPQEKDYVEGESERGTSVTGLETDEDEDDDLLEDEDLADEDNDDTEAKPL